MNLIANDNHKHLTVGTSVNVVGVSYVRINMGSCWCGDLTSTVYLTEDGAVIIRRENGNGNYGQAFDERLALINHWERCSKEIVIGTDDRTYQSVNHALFHAAHTLAYTFGRLLTPEEGDVRKQMKAAAKVVLAAKTSYEEHITPVAFDGDYRSLELGGVKYASTFRRMESQWFRDHFNKKRKRYKIADVFVIAPNIPPKFAE